MPINNVVKIVGPALAVMVALSACGGGSSTTAEGSQPPSSSSASAASADGSGARSYTAAAWALPISSAGDKLGALKGDSFSVDIYQVATGVASKDSSWVDKETKESLLKKGDPIVYLNYVVTNTSAADIPLGEELITLGAKYEDWKYMVGMLSDSNSAGYEEHGLTNSGVKEEELAPFILKPGESFNIARTIAYTAGKEADVKATMTPENAAGDLDFDKEEEAETTVTLK
ncbi:hypothetical protein ACPFL9_01315 [Paenarthrobacter sp. NyZ202]|uniref:hypothetical protein n=1 Tax=Paenarthrobacter sp. NyZ202 TaxID=3402689 RepID=UPI003CF0DAE4